MPRRGLRLLVMFVLFCATAAQAADDAGFSAWLQDFKVRALNEGVSAKVADAALNELSLDDSVITLDQKQPESKITLAKYLTNTVNARRIRQGKALMEEYRPILKKISAQYGVQPQYLVALWGIESDYGAMKGNFSVVKSLATLAYEGRRREFFSNELIAALKIIQHENMEPYDLVGSWAGAMGDCQFMPTTYLKYAVDADHDGHRDIWNTAPDVFASIANYLHDLGWKADRGWGSAVTFPSDLATDEADITQGYPVRYWHKRGLTIQHPDALGDNEALLYAIYVGDNEAAYLVTDNYKALLQWNRSRYFATAVGMLADQIGD